jgi:hypothetical protein
MRLADALRFSSRQNLGIGGIIDRASGRAYA